MSIWDSKGNASCGCGNVFSGARTREGTIQMLRARGWHHSVGSTYGGADYEALLCPACARDERRRKRSEPDMDQSELPIDWDNYRVEVKGEGFQSR